MSFRAIVVNAGLLMLLAGCGSGNSPTQQPSITELRSATDGISAEGLLEHVRVLSSDRFEGRGPGGAGEQLTVDYLVQEFRDYGLKPGAPDGGWTQEVPLVGIKSVSQAELTLNGQKSPLTWPQDYVAWTGIAQPESAVVDSPLIFVGYGVEASEYGWDDFKDADLSGRTLVMLVNDPQIPDPEDPSRLDPKFFKGKEMTYYGRWTYKLEIAARKGAASAIIVHETGPAGYPYFVVVNSWGGENFTLKSRGSEPELPVAAWFSNGRARSLFRELGFDFDELKQRALQPEFVPIPLPASVTFRMKSQFREITSRNVIAKIEGSQHPGECVVVTAHWDHLGINPELDGDQIYNGALDNATGVSGMLALAKSFAGLRPPPSRSLVFLAAAAEEQGLLGAKYYCENPSFPMNRTLANINLDGLNQWGPTRDLVVIGYGASTMDALVEEMAAVHERVVKGDPEPEKGFYYRSDHFQFAKKGVPALFLDSGVEFIGLPEGFGTQKRQEYTNDDYHKVSDEIKEDWNLAGAVEDLRVLADVMYRVVHDETWPRWHPGNEFEAIRLQSLK